MNERPLLVYDGNCGFCRRWVARWRRLTGERVEYIAWQDLGDRHPEIPREDFAAAVHLRDSDGRWTRGAAASLGALRGVPVLGLAAWAYERVPGFAAASEAFYRRVARNRGRW
jgi:predicted DCC family thiol-disulfide oxidoreductase YuxK